MIIYDLETRSFTSTDVKKKKFNISSKQELGIGAGIGALASGIGGSIIANKKAKKKADKLGLTGDERKKYIRNKTLVGAGVGAAGGAVVGAGAAYGRQAYLGNKYQKAIAEKHNIKGGKLYLLSRDDKPRAVTPQESYELRRLDQGKLVNLKDGDLKNALEKDQISMASKAFREDPDKNSGPNDFVIAQWDKTKLKKAIKK